jgi:alpha-ribazole phosphatase/probable phosphoglycerate mutase
MTRLALVRHAEPEETAHGRCYGSLDVGLSQAGREHAARLAVELAGLEVDAVVASPRTRARETAESIAAARGLPVTIADDLREIDFGSFEGRAYEEIERSEPELFRAWMETPTAVRFPGGESYGDLRVRAVRALDAVREAHGSAVVVTHGGVIRAGLAGWLELPDHAIFRLDQSYCGVTLVEWVGETPIVRLLNGSLG